MSDIKARIAAVVRVRASRGEFTGPDQRAESEAVFGVFAAWFAALADAGFAVVRLPEPDNSAGGTNFWGEDVVAAEGLGTVRIYPEDHRYPVRCARDLAAQILSAAKYAEGNHE